MVGRQANRQKQVDNIKTNKRQNNMLCSQYFFTFCLHELWYRMFVLIELCGDYRVVSSSEVLWKSCQSFVQLRSMLPSARILRELVQYGSMPIETRRACRVRSSARALVPEFMLLKIRDARLVCSSV